MVVHASSWWLYVLRTGDGALYTGISTDVARRLREHAGSVRGARRLRARGPLLLQYWVDIGERGVALRAEHAMKRLPRRDKLALVVAAPRREALLARLQLLPLAAECAADVPP